MKYSRPKHLNLLVIKLPLPGILSILHRVSGVILLGSLPFALAALEWSLGSEKEYEQIASCLSHPFIKLFVWGVAWALFHHLCAGIRFLLLDIHIGIELPAARFSSVVAFVASIFLTLIFGVWLW